jgi:putative peptidoglycan lipid II flippase
MGVALGVVLGAILQLAVSTVGLLGMGFDYRFRIYWKNKGFRQVLRLLPPRSLDQGIDYVNSIVETNLASRFIAGSVLAYKQVTSLTYVPVNLIGVAISTAAFPKMTERIAQGRPDLFKIELQTVLRVIIWLALPVTVIAVFGRGYIINFIVNGGDPYMASILAILAISILFRSVYFISARSFYAQQDTRTPLYISLFTIALNITLAVWFSLGLDMGVHGLAWAAVIVSAVEIAILFYIMSRRIKGLFDRPFINAIVRMLSSAGFMAVVTYLAVAMLPLSATDQRFFDSFPKFVLIAGISFLAYFLFSYIFKLKEVQPVLAKIQKILFKAPEVKDDPESHS